MHTDNTQTEKPTGDATSPADQHTDLMIISGVRENGKVFATLAAEFAVAGHALMRNERGSLFFLKWGQIKLLSDLGEAKRYLAQQIGGGQ
jgi:hypothetical protein